MGYDEGVLGWHTDADSEAQGAYNTKCIDREVDCLFGYVDTFFDPLRLSPVSEQLTSWVVRFTSCFIARF